VATESLAAGLQTYIFRLYVEYSESIGFYSPKAGFTKFKEICCLEISRLDPLKVLLLRRSQC